MHGICKYFPGVKALDGVELQVRPGTVHTLMGENGAGLSPVLERTVADNLWLGREPMKNKFMCDNKALYTEAEALFKKLNLEVDVYAKMKDLTVAKQQMVEIAKAVSHDSNIVIMDEPTSALTDAEVEDLFRIIADLKAKNVAIIYISHKMDEIFRISDDITVFRDSEECRDHLYFP